MSSSMVVCPEPSVKGRGVRLPPATRPTLGPASLHARSAANAGVNGCMNFQRRTRDWAGPLARAADQRDSSDSPKFSTSRKSRSWERAIAPSSRTRL